MSASARSRPVAVLGMHRSGTSLVAGVLEAMGLDLGPHETMLPVVGDENPRGYFEQNSVRLLNDELLETLGGSWYRPPPLAPGWEDDPRLEPLYPRAAEICSELFGAAARPGFKDPRMSLTLAFWRRITGPMDCVVCTRPVAAVAASLRHRYRRGPVRVPPWDHMRRQNWRRLTRRYLESAMREAATAAHIVVDYDEWFAAPSVQLERLADFLGDVPDAGRERARALIDPALRHHVGRASAPAAGPARPPLS